MKKQFFRSFFSFSRAERMGLVGLLGLLILLLVVRFTMHFWLQNVTPVTNEAEIVTAWTDFNTLNNNEIDSKEVKSGAVATKAVTKRNISKNDHQVYNLNTVDSQQLVSLWGIGPKLAHRILAYRNTHGPYTNHSELRNVYHFSDTVYSILKTRLIIEPQK